MGLDCSITSPESSSAVVAVIRRHRRDRFFALFAALGLLLDLALDFAFARTRSWSFLPPVSRFHSSKVSFEIFPSTRSCANLRRCAWLLNGMLGLRQQSVTATAYCSSSDHWRARRTTLMGPFRPSTEITRLAIQRRCR